MREKIIELLYAENVRSDCGIERLADEICAIDPVKWVPVIEGLPEEGKQVLVCDDFGEIYIAEYETFSDGEWRWRESMEYRSLYGIVAWMPLPEPWKGEEDERIR